MNKLQATRWLVLWVLAGPLFTGLGTTRCLWAQFGGMAGGEAPREESSGVFMPAPRALRQHLVRARQALDEKRYSDAVLELGSLLSEAGRDDVQAGGEAQDYFIGAVGQSGAQASLKAEAQRLLGNLPPEGREYYELQFGAEARALLEQAVAAGDAGRLTEVIRKYFHTKAGYEATMVLGRYQLDHGQPLAAALCFKRIADVASAAQLYEPELSLLLAACWLYANVPERASQTLVALRRRMPEAKLQAGNRPIDWFQQEDQALAWLESLLGGRSRLAVPEAVDWLMFRGNAARNARSLGGLPLRYSRWRVPTVNNRGDEQLVQQLAKEYVSQSLPVLPSLHPLVVNDVVLTRSPQSLIAVSFHNGKRIWEFPWFESADELATRASVERGQPSQPADRMGELTQRLWSDSPYGQMSSDGQSVFVLLDLGYAQAASYPSQILVAPMGRPFVNPRSPAPHNRLVGLDLTKEGKLRWMVGGQDGEDEPKLAGAFFLGAPLPLLERLYALVEIKGEIRLVVLDGATGRMEWQQQLAHVDSRTIIQDNSRRLAGASPAFADGVLVCPTSAGAVVAVDLATRSLLWGYQYEQKQPLRSQMGWQAFSGQTNKTGEGWFDATAAIADGRVLLTPIESDFLYGLDLLTGEHAWAPRKRDESLYVGCVHEGVALIVGKHKLLGVQVADGKDAWTEAIQLSSEMPSGRGFYADRFYYLPTTNAEILKIDVARGVVASRTRTKTPLGNLVCYKDEVISQGVDWLAAFHQTEPLRARVVERLRANPDDAWALAKQGELLLEDGEQRQALLSLRRAHQLDPQNDAVRALLIASLLDAIRDDFAANRAFSREVEPLIDQPAQRAEYLRLVATGLQAAGELEEAFDAFMRLADSEESSVGPVQLAGPPMEEVEPSLKVRRDRWTRARLAALLAAASPSQRASMDRRVEARWKAALESNDAAALREFIGYFGPHAAADRARLQLAEMLAASGDVLEAELLLLRLEDSPDDATAAAAAAKLARLLEKAGHLEEAAACYRSLASRWGDAPCCDGKTGAQLLAAASEANDGLRRALQATGQWPYGKTEWAEVDREMTPFPGYQRVYPIALQSLRGPLPQGLQLVMDQRRNAVVLRNGLGNDFLQVSLGNNGRFYPATFTGASAKADGHLLLVSLGHELAMIDALRAAGDPQEAILWRRDLLEPIPGVVLPAQQLQARSVRNRLFGSRVTATDRAGRPLAAAGPLNDEGFYYQRLRELICVAPLTGETMWVRENVEQGSDVFGDEELLFVAPPSGEEAMVLSAQDGRVLGQRKIAVAERRWATSGRRLLVVSEDEREQPELRLYDVWAERDIWRREFAKGAAAKLVGHDEVAVMQRDGKFAVLSLESDAPVLEASLPPAPRLEQICVFRSSSQYFLAIHEPGFRTAEQDIELVAAPGGLSLPMVDGRLYAFDRRTGKPQWRTPAVVGNYAMPPDQPAEIPLLVFLRHVTVKGGKPRRTHSSILCIDRRDGRVLLEKDYVPAMILAYDLAANPETAVVTLTLPGAALSATFTNEPLPAAPPAGAGAGAPPQPRKNRLLQVAGAIRNALEHSLPRSKDQPE